MQHELIYRKKVLTGKESTNPQQQLNVWERTGGPSGAALKLYEGRQEWIDLVKTTEEKRGWRKKKKEKKKNKGGV